MMDADQRGHGRLSSSESYWGPYRLLKELGHGGQGSVYLAEDTRLGRRVALKVLSTGNALSATALLRFRAEAERAAKVNHPGLAQVYEWGGDEGQPYLAMEFIDGRTLADHLKDGAAAAERMAEFSDAAIEYHSLLQGSTLIASPGAGAPPSQAATPAPTDQTHERDRGAAHRSVEASSGPGREAIAGIVNLIESAARALHAAHEAGLVHRDIKPGNLILTQDRGLVIIDFGLASDETALGANLTMTGDLLGTPAYMSPEQIAAKRIGVDRRSDVYSLGVTLYECLTLRRPFRAPSREQLYREILSTEAPNLHKLNPAVSEDLRVIVSCAMEKDADRRYQTALEFAEDLRRLREYEPIRARPLGPFGRSIRWSQRNPAVAALLATVLIALSVGVIWTTLKNRELSKLNRTLEQTTAEAKLHAERAKEESAAKSVALESEQRAVAEKASALAEYERLADARRLANAQREAEALWPLHPSLIPRLQAWQTKYAQLPSAVSDHERALAALRAQAVKSGEGWSFGEDVDLEFRHQSLSVLVADLKSALATKTGVFADIEQRLEKSRRIETESVTQYEAIWSSAKDRILASPIYSNLVIAPQTGLIPLGPDPTSGLEEFLHWQTHDWDSEGAALPTRDDAKRMIMTEGRGVILVLIPGGTFLMGAQNSDPTRPNYDPEVRDVESPVHEMTLAPYFLSKYEMTQGQWLRAAGKNPSDYSSGWESEEVQKGAVDARHPVEQVSWEDAQRLLVRLDLELPTEAQWERAARAGASDTWAGTSALGEIRNFGNIAGAEAARFFSSHTAAHRDRFVIHAPVGSFLANGFGLHDMTGNVWEWSRDTLAAYAQAPEGGDGERRSDSRLRVARSGGFNGVASLARIALRSGLDPSVRDVSVGLRPARRIATE